MKKKINSLKSLNKNLIIEGNMHFLLYLIIIFLHIFRITNKKKSSLKYLNNQLLGYQKIKMIKFTLILLNIYKKINVIKIILALIP